MNKIQYISTRHSSKDEAKNNKRSCNKLHTVYYKELSFEQIADLLEQGHTIGRIGNETDFVAIDVDKTSISISTVIEHYKDNPDIRVSFSSSNNPLKYHILVNLHRTVNVSEYANAVENTFNNIKKELLDNKHCDFFELDTNAANFYQCFFGPSIDNPTEHILDNSTRLFKWTKKDEEMMVYKEKEIYNHFPLNTAEYCRMNNLKIMDIPEPIRYDIVTPSMSQGRLKCIAEGYRYNWCKRIGAQLLLRCLYCNYKLGGNYTKFDYLKTFEYLTKRNVVKCDEFIQSQDYKSLELFFDNKWDILANKPFEYIEETLGPYFKCSKKRYRIKAYSAQTSSQIILDHQINETEVLFTDKEELETLCNNSYITVRYFTDYCKKLNMNVVFEVLEQRSDKGKSRKHDIVKGMSKDEFDKYCKDNKVTRRMKCYLKKYL